ncbi:MAG: hypothetical protein CG439_1811 [Methylococcaceae bacterium NSP1-2]|nr:hypothetical protein [Methylococcaceae bacterium]OYV17134.1 MAG: hypothetical protein CG439_1811 [Methylococcaceae bacterium NSP1-2]
MKKIVKILSLASIFLAFSANADVQLKDNSEILGKWNLYAEAIRLDGEQKAVKIEWDFQADGTLMTTSTDSVGRTKEMKIPIKYSVENGEIKKQTTPGREKYDSCKVLEKDAAKMTLKCSGMFFFLKKI